MISVAKNIIGTCWMIFAVVWLLAAISTKRTVYRESPAQRSRYVVPLLIGCVFIFRGHLFPYPLNVQVIPYTDAIALAAAILCIGGLGFCLWARATLGRNWSGTVTLKEDHELIVRGPYRFVRHPIYTGLLAMFIATVIQSGHVAGIIGAAIVFVSFWIKLIEEEQVMLKQFPDQYPSYQQRVKRIIPFIL
ncbi:MAG: isoprenylcysteine carboxylmethyltransferase family protein [Verrucomicrobiota bacterium]